MNGSSVKTELDGHGSLQQMYHIRLIFLRSVSATKQKRKKEIKMHTRQKHVHA